MKEKDSIDILLNKSFSRVQEKDIILNNQESFNYLIEGDNLLSLESLIAVYLEKIDVIYIDPPYNTKSILNYKDKLDDLEWLNFIKIRLSMTYNLLSLDGVIFISIDDNEQALLKVLCDSIFGKSNFISMFVWKKHNGGKNDCKFVSVDTEYILCYAKNKSNLVFNKKLLENTYTLQDEYFKTRGYYSLNKLDRGSLYYVDSLDYEIEAPDGSIIVAGNDYSNYKKRKSGSFNKKDWCWRWSLEKVKWGIENGFIVFKKVKNKWSVYYKQYELVDNGNNLRSRSVPFSNLIENITTSQGKADLDKIIRNSGFDYPKPVELIKYLLNLYYKKDAIVLDFFAGSGTTGQAVLEMNKIDNGTRQFILCTNNENNICEEITYERLRTVITGRRKDDSIYSDGMNSNLVCLKVMSSKYE